MKPVYIVLTLAMTTLTGCSSEKNNGTLTSDDIEKRRISSVEKDINQASNLSNEISKINEKQKQEKNDTEANIKDDSAENQLKSTVQTKSSSIAKFVAISDYLALRSNQKWTWAHLANLPNVEEWLIKTPQQGSYNPENKNYYIEANLKSPADMHNIIFMRSYGIQQQPKLITLGSIQSYEDDEELRGVYKIKDFFDLHELVPIKSNCEIDNPTFKQKFYKWQKEGFQPLYVYSVYTSGNAGGDSEYGIAESLEEFFQPEYESTEIQVKSTNNNYDHIICTFDK